MRGNDKPKIYRKHSELVRQSIIKKDETTMDPGPKPDALLRLVDGTKSKPPKPIRQLAEATFEILTQEGSRSIINLSWTRRRSTAQGKLTLTELREDTQNIGSFAFAFVGITDTQRIDVVTFSQKKTGNLHHVTVMAVFSSAPPTPTEEGTAHD